MRSRQRSPKSIGLLVLLFIVALVLAACGSQAGASIVSNVGDQLGQAPRGAGGDGDVGVPAASGGAAEEPAQGGGPDAAPGNAAPVEQRIIKTGQVTLEVDNVASTLGEVRSLADALGGYVGGSQAGTLEESATLTLRVPAARFEELLGRLHELESVKVVGESTTEQDVTREIVDLDARIRNLEASEASYRALLERAERIEDILSVQSRLDEVRGQIEQLRGQLQTVEGQADLSTLTVTLIPRGEPVEAVQATWDPGAQLEGALAALVGFGQGVLGALIWFVIVWIPILLLLAVIGVVVWRVALEVRRRWAVAPEPPGAEPMR
jgi:flagellar basal body-associated protein FliL